MAEHLVPNRVVAYPVIKRTVNQLGTMHPHLGVGQGGHEIGDDVVLFPGEWKLRALLVVYPLSGLALKGTKFNLIARSAKSLNDNVLAVSLGNNLYTV